jgi:hypothetical protein
MSRAFFVFTPRFWVTEMKASADFPKVDNFHFMIAIRSFG